MRRVEEKRSGGVLCGVAKALRGHARHSGVMA